MPLTVGKVASEIDFFELFLLYEKSHLNTAGGSLTLVSANLTAREYPASSESILSLCKPNTVCHGAELAPWSRIVCGLPEHPQRAVSGPLG